MQFWPPDDEHMCSKHVEAWNKLIVKQKFCASSWLITEMQGQQNVKKYPQQFYIVYSVHYDAVHVQVLTIITRNTPLLSEQHSVIFMYIILNNTYKILNGWYQNIYTMIVTYFTAVCLKKFWCQVPWDGEIIAPKYVKDGTHGS